MNAADPPLARDVEAARAAREHNHKRDQPRHHGAAPGVPRGALAQTEARQVNAAKTAIALVRITLKGALEQVERVENDIADHWHKCLERDERKDSIQ